MQFNNHNETLCIVLATGDGKALMPLTARRAAAALFYAGNYRVIDFALTNCMHSGLRRITVFTQFNSLSLQNHLRDGWSIFNTDLGEYVTAVSPPINEHLTVYSGQANALHENLYFLDGATEDTVMVISGEQIYRMDYAAVLQFHAEHEADVTIVAIDSATAGQVGFGAHLRLDGDRVAAIEHHAPAAPLPPDDSVYAPMEVYAFKRQVLLDVLAEAGRDGTRSVDIIELLRERLLGRKRLLAYQFGGKYGRVTQDRYWRPLDGLDHYYETNMDLLKLEPPLDLYQADWPIRTYQMQQPPARTVPGRSDNEGICVNSIVAGGTVIAGGGVSRSVLGNRVHIQDGATVEDSILFQRVTVGEGARVRRAICDRGVSIPPYEEIGIDRKHDAERFHVTPAGVVVIPSNYRFE